MIEEADTGDADEDDDEFVEASSDSESELHSEQYCTCYVYFIVHL